MTWKDVFKMLLVIVCLLIFCLALDIATQYFLLHEGN